MASIDIRVTAADAETIKEFLHLCGIIQLTSGNRKETNIQLNINHENWQRFKFSILEEPRSYTPGPAPCSEIMAPLTFPCKNDK